MKIENYQDALFHVKKGFLILGLTGYTGAGCTTFRKLLEENKPELPSFRNLFGRERDQAIVELHYAVANNKNDIEFISERDDKIHEKLNRTWKEIEWKNFIAVEISSVIFAYILHYHLTKKEIELLSFINKETVSDSLRSGLDLITSESDDFNVVEYKNLIEAYEFSEKTYQEFKSSATLQRNELIEVMQNFGDEIRKYGQLLQGENLKENPKNLFLLPEAVRRIITAYRKEKHAIHFVIDAFRNPFEVDYFRWRYSEFYLIGILRDKNKRKEALKLDPTEFNKLEERERGSRKTINRTKENISDWIISQDIEECMLKADVFIENKEDKSCTFPFLKFNIIKLLSLMKIPGCIPPSAEERNMQIAMTARQMSGCISRRVGAVITNKSGFIIGVGWNDPPRGQVPCALRCGKDLADGGAESIFSDFERSNIFVQHIKKNYNIDRPFCFREEYEIIENKKKSEFTRALHAEENAFFQAIRNSANELKGATLYTTASPCNLCAKKAYQLGIDRIIYIDEYPGIAIEQTIRTGVRINIKIDRFHGIVGAAYHKLFSSLIPEKDLIKIFM